MEQASPIGWRLFCRMKAIEISSPCKINLVLRVLGRRSDGFHELETLFHPVALYDELRFEVGGRSVELECSDHTLPRDDSNLVVRAAEAFREAAGISEGIRIHLEKHIPQQAGLGGGSANAAWTLRAMNRLFGNPIASHAMHDLAERLGADIPFFLLDGPALGFGRGERLEPLDFFPALSDHWVLLLHPGFGISTAWAYRELGFMESTPPAEPGKARELAEHLIAPATDAVCPDLFFNSFQAVVFRKFPILELMVERLRELGAVVAMLSGSGSAVFAIVRRREEGERMLYHVRSHYGREVWGAVAPMALPSLASGSVFSAARTE